ncbi:Fimbrial protein [Gammaproteobacteria bacterium]|nr:Fimbrial protein [Gammaproteobacteria bacterium]
MKRTQAGFTMIELMIVVAVIGILSAVAIPSFRSYIHRSRTAEAFTFLGEVRQRQEAYRAEFGQYCSVSAPAGGGSMGSWAPGTLPSGGNAAGWDGTPGDWSMLGAAPDGPTRFQYRTVAGPPGSTPPGGLGYDGSDFWFVAQAQGDMDGDGEVMIVEAYSASRVFFVGDASMSPLPSRYE